MGELIKNCIQYFTEILYLEKYTQAETSNLVNAVLILMTNSNNKNLFW